MNPDPEIMHSWKSMNMINVVLLDASNTSTSTNLLKPEIITLSDSESDDEDEITSSSIGHQQVEEPPNLYSLITQILQEDPNGSMPVDQISSILSSRFDYYYSMPPRELNQTIRAAIEFQSNNNEGLIDIKSDGICKFVQTTLIVENDSQVIDSNQDIVKVEDDDLKDEFLYEIVANIMRSSNEMESWSTLELAAEVQALYPYYASNPNTQYYVESAVMSRKDSWFKLIPGSCPERWSLVRATNMKVAPIKRSIIDASSCIQDSKRLKMSPVKSVELDRTQNFGAFKIVSVETLRTLDINSSAVEDEEPTTIPIPFETMEPEDKRKSLMKAIENCMMSSISVKYWTVSTLCKKLQTLYPYYKNEPNFARYLVSCLNSEDSIIQQDKTLSRKRWRLKPGIRRSLKPDNACEETKEPYRSVGDEPLLNAIKHILESSKNTKHWMVVDIVVDLLNMFPHYRSQANITSLVTGVLKSKENLIIDRVYESNQELWALNSNKGKSEITTPREPLHEFILKGMLSHKTCVWSIAAIIRDLLQAYPFYQSNSKVNSLVEEALQQNQNSLFHQIPGANPSLWYLNINYPACSSKMESYVFSSDECSPLEKAQEVTHATPKRNRNKRSNIGQHDSTKIIKKSLRTKLKTLPENHSASHTTNTIENKISKINSSEANKTSNMGTLSNNNTVKTKAEATHPLYKIIENIMLESKDSKFWSVSELKEEIESQYPTFKRKPASSLDIKKALKSKENSIFVINKKPGPESWSLLRQRPLPTKTFGNRRKIPMISMLASVLRGKKLTREEIVEALKDKYPNLKNTDRLEVKVSANLSRLQCFKKIKYIPEGEGRKCNKWTITKF